MSLSTKFFLTLVGLFLVAPLAVALGLFGALLAIKVCADWIIGTWEK